MEGAAVPHSTRGGSVSSNGSGRRPPGPPRPPDSGGHIILVQEDTLSYKGRSLKKEEVSGRGAARHSAAQRGAAGGCGHLLHYSSTYTVTGLLYIIVIINSIIIINIIINIIIINSIIIIIITIRILFTNSATP